MADLILLDSSVKSQQPEVYDERVAEMRYLLAVLLKDPSEKVADRVVELAHSLKERPVAAQREEGQDEQDRRTQRV